MTRWSLRLKLSLYTAGLAGLVLALFGLGISWHLYREGIADLDKDMQRVARVFFSKLETKRAQINWNDKASIDGLFPTIGRLYYFEIIQGDRIVYRSRALIDAQFPPLVAASEFTNLKLQSNPVRAGEFREQDIVLRLAVGMHQVLETKDDLLRSYLIAAPIVLLLVGGGSLWIGRRTLAPIEKIAIAAEHITAQRLDERLPVPPTHDEIARLTAVLNRMIDRLEASFQQATRFTADASHELKTPLTIIRGELEAALRSSELPPPQEKLLVNLLEEAERLGGITEGLLLLSRADAGKLTLELRQLNLSELLTELIEDVEILAQRREIRIETEIPADIHLVGNSQFLHQLLLNLFDNAIKYNHLGGTLEVRLEPGKDSDIVTVGNTGPGLAREEAARIFDRFYRAESSRERPRGGHGLGLSICREIARAHHGEITVHLERAGWTEFRVELPAAGAASSAEDRPSAEPLARVTAVAPI